MQDTGPERIEARAVCDLVRYARNARNPSDAQVAKISGSSREFGFNNLVLVDGESGIIAGHGRDLAALKLGLDRVPVIELAHLTEAQKRAYILADNRLAGAAGWEPGCDRSWRAVCGKRTTGWRISRGAYDGKRITAPDRTGKSFPAPAGLSSNAIQGSPDPLMIVIKAPVQAGFLSASGCFGAC